MALTTTTRETITAAVIAQLQTITLVNGYHTAIGTSVTDWQTHNLEITDLPNIELADEVVESETRGSLKYMTLNIELTGRVASADITAGRNLSSDITCAMALSGFLPDEVYNINLIGNTEFKPEQLNKKIIKVVMNYEILYRQV